MASVGAFEAKATFGKLLARAEKGESTVITRRGVPVARIVPEPRADVGRSVREWFAAVRESARHDGPPFTVEEILSLRDEGRR